MVCYIRESLVSSNHHNDTKSDKYDRQLAFAVWKSKKRVRLQCYFGQIRDVNPYVDERDFHFFFKYGKPTNEKSSEPQNFSTICLLNDLDEKQRMEFLEKVDDPENRACAERFIIYGEEPVLGEEIYAPPPNVHKVYLNKIVQVVVEVAGRSETENFALVVGAAPKCVSLEIVWLLTKQQALDYARCTHNSKASEQLAIANIGERELLFTDWTGRIEVRSVHIPSSPVHVRAALDSIAPSTDSYYCRFACKCQPSGEGGELDRDGGGVRLEFDRRWTLRAAASRGPAGAAVALSTGEHLAGWISELAECEVGAA